MINEFWRTPDEWPNDPPGHVFLARAFDEIGVAMFGEKWPKKEEKPERELTVEDLDADDLALSETQDEHQTMWVAIKDEIVKQCLKRDLVSAVRAIEGGAMTKVKSEMWNAENLDWRFLHCQMSLRSPFERSPSGGTHWIFLSRESLDQYLMRQPYGPTPFQSPKHLSPYVRFLIFLTEHMGMTSDYQPTKEEVIATIDEKWTGPKLSNNLRKVMATLVREPESQLGRAKKKIAK
jgi:hypothetical protein